MSQNSAIRLGEIFTAAGLAFTKLGELAMTLHANEDTPHSGKWDEEEIRMLRAAIKRFGEEINKISDNIKNKTIGQLKSGIKRKAMEDAKLTVGANAGPTTGSPPNSSAKKQVVTSPVATHLATTFKSAKVAKTNSAVSVNSVNSNNADNDSKLIDSMDSLSNSHVQVFDGN